MLKLSGDWRRTEHVACFHSRYGCSNTAGVAKLEAEVRFAGSVAGQSGAAFTALRSLSHALDNRPMSVASQDLKKAIGPFGEHSMAYTEKVRHPLPNSLLESAALDTRWL